MGIRQASSYIPLGDVHPFGIKLVVGLMKNHNINYDCDLYDITKHLEKLTTRELEHKRLYTTGEVIKVLNHIRENKLLG